jgi:transposase
METLEGRCPNCQRLEAELARLREQLTQALARIAELEAEVARLKKNSSTSSKPPSSDIVKPPKPIARGRGKRKPRRGGQPGHPRHERTPFPPGRVDHICICPWEGKPLGPEWVALDEYRTLQQVELAEKLFEVTEYRAQLYRNEATGEVVAAALPEEVLRAGLIGPRLSALAAYQKGACHMSYTSIERFWEDVLGLDVCRGQLAKVVQKASAALEPAYAQLQAALPGQPVLNVDETGHPECGKKLWTWGFHAPGPVGFTWFHIDPSRSSEVLQEFLGETFGGVLGCDYFSAYRKFLDETDAVMQFCWAHLIRDVKFLTTLTDPVTRRYGERLLGTIQVLFRIWHRRAPEPTERWKREAGWAEKEILKVARRAPSRSEAQNIAKRFREHGDYYFTFLKVPGVEPTNNAMERGFRHLVIDRKVTQGTRGEPGRRWCERIWTVLATCAQHARSAFQFIHQSILAYFTNHSFPSLLPQGP